MADENNLPQRTNKDAPGQMDLALAREFLDVSRKEMELRSQELTLRKDSQVQGHEYAISALKEQGSDRERERTHRRAAMRQYLIFAGVILLLLLGFAGFALAYNKEAVVLETLKILGPFVGGMGAGAFLGYRKGHRDGSQLPQPPIIDGDPE